MCNPYSSSLNFSFSQPAPGTQRLSVESNFVVLISCCSFGRMQTQQYCSQSATCFFSSLLSMRYFTPKIVDTAIETPLAPARPSNDQFCCASHRDPAQAQAHLQLNICKSASPHRLGCRFATQRGRLQTKQRVGFPIRSGCNSRMTLSFASNSVLWSAQRLVTTVKRASSVAAVSFSMPDRTMMQIAH